jgi:AsmA protein
VADVATADPAVLGRLKARLPFKADARAIEVDGLSLALDDTTFTGRLAVTDLAAGAVRFDLAADRLDLDRYLPPPRTAAPAAPKAAGAVVAGGAALPTEALRRLDLDGSLRVGAWKLGGARLTEARTHWHAKGGTITQTAEARLYGGSGETRSTLDARRAQPAMTLKGALRGVDLASLLSDTTGRGALSGVGTIEADLRWTGLTEPEIRRSLDGSARVALRDGAVAGFDLDGTVRNALAALQGGKAGTVAGQTAFAELTASLAARSGVLTNRDLKATSALLSLSGEGSIDLPADRIDYLARATLLDSAQGLLTGRLADLRDTPIPVRISGRLEAPAVRLDLEEVLKSKAGQQIQRKVEEKLKGEWGDKLRKFLDR